LEFYLLHSECLKIMMGATGKLGEREERREERKARREERGEERSICCDDKHDGQRFGR